VPKIAYAQFRRQQSKKVDQAVGGATGGHMTIFTNRELEFLIGLRTNWGKLYLSEVRRLLNEANNKCAVPFMLRTFNATDDPSSTVFGY
jgi:hypothetical protein